MSVADRRQREKEERRNQILDAAQRRFYEQGLDKATMDDVAAEAQLGKGTLYLYFKNKNELLAGLILRRHSALIQSFETAESAAGNGNDLVRELLSAYTAQIAEPEAHLRMVVTHWAAGKPIEHADEIATQVGACIWQLFSTLRRAVERGQADGTIRIRRDPGRLAMHLWSCVNGALLRQLQLRCLPKTAVLEPLAPSVAESIDILMESIAPRGNE